MCGIVGILGRAPVAEQLVDSLKRLEYRGYDSAGVATLEGNHLERRRAEGKLRNLEARLQASPLSGRTGVGYPRWCTTGSSKIFASCGLSWRRRARNSTAKPTPRSSRIWSIPTSQKDRHPR